MVRRLWSAAPFAVAATLVTVAALHGSAAVVAPSAVNRWASWSMLVLAILLGALARTRSTVWRIVPVVVSVMLVEDWFGPGTPGLVFVAAIAASGSLAGWLAVAAVVGMPSSAARRRLLGAGGALALGGAAVTVLWLDPRRHGCHACAVNPFAAADRPGFVHRIDVMVSACAAGIAVIAAVHTAVRVARRQGRLADLAMPVSGLSATLLAAATISQRSPDGALTGAPYLVLSALLAFMSATIWIPQLVDLRDRRALLALVNRAAANPTGDIESSLRAATRDSRLQLCYVTDDGVLVNAAGESVGAAAGHSIDVERDGRRIAVLTPSGTAPSSERVFRDAAVIAGAGLAHEREAAVLSDRTKVLAAARRAAIERGDLERRRLERELHDHAQQRLASIMIELRRAANRQSDAERIEAAHEHVGRALEQVRAIAHGIYPTGLAEEGLPAALEELSLHTSHQLVVRTTSAHRADPIVDATAYLVVAGYLGRAGTKPVEVSVQLGEVQVVISGRGRDANDPELAGLRARAAALGGRWTAGDEALEVVLPCGS